MEKNIKIYNTTDDTEQIVDDLLEKFISLTKKDDN